MRHMLKVNVVAIAAVAVDPFDCYKGDGSDYTGLVNTAETGEMCAVWSDVVAEGPKAGHADFNYCRNPGGSEPQPWCYAITGEKKVCAVKKCPDKPPDLEPWIAPKGSKGANSTTCAYQPPETKHFRSFRGSEGRSCKAKVETDRMVAKQWLINDKLVTAIDEQDCAKKCLSKAGAEYITFFGKADKGGGNCGCYRECVLEDKDLTINSPNAFRIE